MEGFYQIENRNTITGSLLIAFGACIKVLPLVMIPYLLYRGYFKAGIFTIFGIVVILTIPGFIFGFDHYLTLMQGRMEISNPFQTENLMSVSNTNNHSINSLLSSLLLEDTKTEHSLDLKRNIASIDIQTFKIISITVSALLIIATLVFLRTRPFRRSKSRIQTIYELGYILLITPLVFPKQQQYSFFFALPAISYLVLFYLNKFIHPETRPVGIRKTGLIILFILIYFLLNSYFILGHFKHFYDHYKTLIYGIFMIIGLLAFARPEKMNIQEIVKQE
jgi:hypothetical protein